eukprot:symbB.v1.2.019990.t1/scaffold1654.1/size107508/15
MTAMVVKVQCDDGEIYRLTLQEEPSFENIVQLVATCRPGVIVNALLVGKGGYALKYADDEGDLCTLAPATFDDFLDLHKKGNSRVLKLKLTLQQAMNNEKDVPDDSLQSSDRTDADQPNMDNLSQAPPGLEKEDPQDSAGCGGASGPGCTGGGPKRVLGTLRMLREAGMLTPAMFASLTVQWLPLLTQRVARKVDKINHMAREGLDQTMQKILEIIQEQAAATPGLEQQAAPIAEALNGDNGKRRLGEAILEMLKALRGLGFEVQTRFCESVAQSLLPYLENLTCQWFGDKSACTSPWQQHPGSQCSGCGAIPIVGPRFKCTVCPSYDLCGNCYPQKNQLHGSCSGCKKDFQCIISPGKDAKGKGKGCEKTEKSDCHDWQAWSGKGAGGTNGDVWGPESWRPMWLYLAGWMDPAAIAQHFGAGLPGFNPFFPGCAMPFPGMEHAFAAAMGHNAFEEGQEPNCWPMFFCKGKGKGKKGKGKHWWKGHSHCHDERTEPAVNASDEGELEKKVATLVELQLANEEVIRELLAIHDGDVTEVIRLLTS